MEIRLNRPRPATGTNQEAPLNDPSQSSLSALTGVVKEVGARGFGEPPLWEPWRGDRATWRN